MRCVVCGRKPFERARRWRAYRISLDWPHDDPEVVFYCPACAIEEFGPNRIRPLVTWQPDERDQPRRGIFGYDEDD